jgi:hypothetical protein
VNGLTCSWKGREACLELFPEVFCRVCGPGYASDEGPGGNRGNANGTPEPELIVLRNHGVFVAAVTADSVRALYRGGSLSRDVYAKEGISLEIVEAPLPTRKR